jgi:ssDNA-binding Zn-finger/Zn-ribbon topoisomerase 1
MDDKTLKCRDCGQDFIFTKGEQIFYAEKGFPDPIRCPQCRKAKKDSRRDSSAVQQQF